MSDSKTVVVLNRGQRIIDLAPGPNGEKRLLKPGESIETLNDAEAKLLLGYKDVADAAKVIPAAAARIKKLEVEAARLTAENERLKNTTAAHQPHKAAPEPPREDAPRAELEPEPTHVKAVKAKGKKKGK